MGGTVPRALLQHTLLEAVARWDTTDPRSIPGGGLLTPDLPSGPSCEGRMKRIGLFVAIFRRDHFGASGSRARRFMTRRKLSPTTSPLP